MINLNPGLGQVLRQVAVLGDSTSVLLAFVDINFRVQTEAVLVEDGEELTGHWGGCGHCLEGASVQWDLESSTLLGGGVPYGYKGVVMDQWRLSRWQCEDGGDRSDETEDNAGPEG